MKREHWERRWEQAVRLRKKSLALWAPLSWIWGWGVRLRHQMYDEGVLRTRRASLVVVSIGNLVAGGVGKTPVALLLARQLQSYSQPVAILSRGFRRKKEGKKVAWRVRPEKALVEESGDEPWMLASRLASLDPHVQVWVGKDRYHSACAAYAEGARIALLDDGMQHRQLARDWEIVVLGSEDPWGGGHFLPWGLLREDPIRLRRADLILSMGRLSASDRAHLATLTEAPCVEALLRPVRVWEGKEKGVPLALSGKKVGVFCGIGHPQRFIKTLQELGAEVVAFYALADHHRPSASALKRFSEHAEKQNASYLVCTEKDWVKCPPFPAGCLPLAWVEAEIEIVENQQAWEAMVQAIVCQAARIVG